MAATKRIKHLMIDQDVKIAQIAREYGCTRQVAWGVISGIRRSRKLEAYIARKLGARVEELFPQDCQGEAA
jgi:hypothetical protein